MSHIRVTVPTKQLKLESLGPSEATKKKDTKQTKLSTNDTFQRAEPVKNVKAPWKTTSVTEDADLRLETLKGKKNNLGNHFYDAMMSSNWDKFDKLLALGQNVNCKVSNKTVPTPLHVACRRGILHFVKSLLDAGADPLSRVGQEMPPLHLFLAHNRHENGDHLEIVKELLKRGASPMASKFVDGKKASDLTSAWVREPVFAEVHALLLRAEEDWTKK